MASMLLLQLEELRESMKGLHRSIEAMAEAASPSPTSPSSSSSPISTTMAPARCSTKCVDYERELDSSLKEKYVLSSHPLDNDSDGGAKVLDEARGLVCDAVGKVAGVAEDGKEKLSDAVEGITGSFLSAVQAETVSDARGSTKNKAFDAARQGKETLESAKYNGSVDGACNGFSEANNDKDEDVLVDQKSQSQMEKHEEKTEPPQEIEEPKPNEEVGKNGVLFGKLFSDLKFFKELALTTADSAKKNADIMGRKNWESKSIETRHLLGH